VTAIDARLPVVMPARHTSVEVVEFDAEVVVLDTRSRQVHLLGALAALVFDSCDGHTTVDSLIAEITEYSADDDAVVADAIARALAELGGLGLLEGTEPAVPPPCVGCGGVTAPPARRMLKRRIFGQPG
jgi:PqqD family protein of HPr-rel-A system